MAVIQFPNLEEIETLIRVVIREELQTLKADTRNKDPILTRNAVMQMLGLGSTTLWKRMREGAIPFFKVGRKVFFYESEVKSAMKKSEYGL